MCKRSFWITAALAGALGGAGCCMPVEPIVSLEGISTDSARILDSALIGTWLWARGSAYQDDGPFGCGTCEAFAFRVSMEPEPFNWERRRYVVSWPRDCDPGDTVVNRADFTRIGSFHYLDLWTEREPWQLGFISLHYIVRVDRHGDSLIVRSPEFDADADRSAALLSDAPGVGVLGEQWETVATGTTEEMRQWIERRFKAHVFATARSTTVPYHELVLVRAR